VNYSLSKALAPISEEASHSIRSLWLELVDQETTHQKTSVVSNNTFQMKSNAIEEEETEETAPSQEATPTKVEYPLSKKITIEIRSFTDLFSSSSAFTVVMKNDPPLAAQLLGNFRYHFSQLFLSLSWAHSTKNDPHALFQFFFSMSQMMEMAIGLRYSAARLQLPPYHAHEKTLQDLNLLFLFSPEERFLLTTLDRTSLWARFPFTMAENYPQRKPLGLAITLMASGEPSTAALPHAHSLQADCRLAFSILGKILEQKLSFPEGLFEEIAQRAQPLPKPVPTSPLQQAETYPLLRKEIAGHLHRLGIAIGFGLTVENQGKYDSLVLAELSILPIAIEEMLRLITLDKSKVFCNSHDFNEFFSELGKSYKNTLPKALNYQLGRGFYMPASYPEIPIAKAMIASSQSSISHIDIEEGFNLQNKTRAHSPLQDWMPWAEKGIELLDKLLMTLH
jgi:hypothetical protein